MALSTDGRAIVATFDGSRLRHLTAGQRTVSLVADVVLQGAEDTLGYYHSHPAEVDGPADTKGDVVPSG
jgi:hypothetical protein